MQLRIRAAGCQDLDIEIGSDATVAEVKVAATAGCDIDPEAMKVIYRGKVLKDEMTLQACGVDGAQPLHVARGKAPPAEAGAAAASSAVAMDTQPAADAPSDSAAMRVIFKGPGGCEASLEVSRYEPLCQMRGRAAALFGLSGEEIHLVLRGKLLKDDDAAFTTCNLAQGDVLRVAKRALPAAATGSASTAPGLQDAAAAAVAAGAAGAPMPNAFGSGPVDLQTLHGPTIGGRMDLQTLLARGENFDPIAMEAFQQQLAAAVRGPAQAQQVPVEVRLPREVRAMGLQVRRVVAERQGVDVDSIEEDQDLIDHIARTMAQARARGAPVPNLNYFVEHALNRGAQARALTTRLNREADGLDPELEDALMAAEQATAAAAVFPRRLGGRGGTEPTQ